MKKPIILTIILFTVQFLAPIFGQTEQEPRLVVQTGHSSNEAIEKIIFSSDAKLLVSGIQEEKIILWDVASGKELRTFSDEFRATELYSFSPDGKAVALASGTNQNYQIKLWDLASGKFRQTFSGKFSRIEGVAFSPDGKILAGIVNNSIRIWDVESGKEIKTLETSQEHIDRQGNTVVFSPDGKKLASVNNGEPIKIWDLETGKEIKVLTGYSTSSIHFSPDGKFIILDNFVRLIDIEKGNLFAESKNGDPNSETLAISFSQDGRIILMKQGESKGKVKFLDFKTGEVLQKMPENVETVSLSEDISPDGKRQASEEEGGIEIWSLETGNRLRTLSRGNTSLIRSSAISPDEKTIAIGTFDERLKIWDLQGAKSLRTLKEFTGEVLSVSFSPDGKILAIGDEKEITLWDVEGEKVIKSLNENSEVYSVIFSSDGKTLISGSGHGINFWDLTSSKNLKTFSGEERLSCVALSPDEKILASGNFAGEIEIWDIQTGKSIDTFSADIEGISNLYFNSDGKILASIGYEGIKFWDVKTGKQLGDAENPELMKQIPILGEEAFLGASSKNLILKIVERVKIKLLDRKTKKELATLVSLGPVDWVITTPDGQFDTNKLENPQGLHWIMPDAPFTPLSFEVFMRDYYEPNLLARLLKCTEADNCYKDTEFLPREFKPVRNLTELNRTQPTVKIVDIKATAAADLVQVTVEAEETVSEFQRDKQNKFLRSGVEDLRLFRDGQLVGYEPKTEGSVKLDAKGKFTQTFDVRLPKNRDAKEFNFTAYAFNIDRVKSETAQKTYTLPKPLPTAKGSAYIVTIGVNANETKGYNLRYAANDARRLQEELAKNLPKDRYEKIVQIPLISDFDKAGNLTENNATKAKIKGVLEVLAGKKEKVDDLTNILDAKFPKKVSPEDLVLIAFSGHGYADREGIFYLIPYDIGKSADSDLKSVLQKSISSNELSLWLRDIDAGEMMMIVDACHSAAAVQGKDFKPGPMGSRGLGQLSYDKGMRILTATQADNVALELGNLQHGLLTYSLVKNGLQCGEADFQPKDNKLFSNEWLSFAVKDVPIIYDKALKGELKPCLKISKDNLNEWLLVDGVKPKSGVYMLDGRKSNLNLQQPTLFDFSRRDRQFELLDVVLR